MKAIPVDINWHPDLSIYASESYLKSVGEHYGWIGGVDSSGKLRCILPYTVIKKAVFRFARFRVETIWLGEDPGVQEEKSFLNSVVEYLRSVGVDMVVPASNNTIFRTYPDGAVAAPYGSFVVDLSQQEETLWSNVHQKHRNSIRNAVKNGVEIKKGLEHLSTSYELVKTTLKRSSMRFMGHSDFKRLIAGLTDNVEFLIAEHEGIAQGCAVVFYSDYAAYYVYGGSIPKPKAGAMNLLQWEAMKYFKSIGVRHYDFVGARINPEKGSKQEGLSHFKQRFGGRLLLGYMWKYSFNPLKSAVYSLAIRLLIGGDIVDLERHKLKDTLSEVQ